MHMEHQDPEHLDPEHQSPQTSDVRQIAGTPVFSADNQRVGAIERVISETTGERYLVIDPGARRRQIGADRLYVPESRIQASEEDRLILETPLSALPTREWSELPTGAGRG